MTLFDTIRLRPAQAEVFEALAKITGSATTADLQAVLAAHGLLRDRSVIAKRLCEIEALGLVERVGHDLTRRGTPTTWRRVTA
jgi:predicted transcriptional regulator